ncbi:MVP1 domain-containing protein [Suillus decipiens]|nr:MVP1 domain-containing protein [Suillus decipiens]
MFNAPRPAQRYASAPVNGLGGSFVDENPLAASIYDDPWSTAPSPSPQPIPNATSALSSVLAEATIPDSYNRAFAVVDTTNSGETSVNALSRVLSTSGLPATTVDKIVNLVNSRPRVSKLEFFVALALLALAQSGKDISVEQVAARAAENSLPEPFLHLDTLQPSTSALSSPYPTYRQATLDPWSVPRFGSNGGGSDFTAPRSATTINGGAASSLAGSGLPGEWWKTQETVNVTVQGQQGFILNRYTVYEIITEHGAPVHRRYSEFAFLWDCLVRRYPFRLLPPLPPKRVQPDATFIEQRRKGLARFLNAVINHPVIKEDGLLATFLSEASFENWRKHTAISLEEESASKHVDRIEEITVPSDLEDKLAFVQGKISPLIEQWQRICVLAERIIKRRESAAVRIPPSLRRTYLPAHFTLPVFSSHRSHLDGHDRDHIPGPASSTTSLAGSLSKLSLHTAHSDDLESDNQADLARLTNVLRAVVEVNGRCWRGDECELCGGVRQGIAQVASHTQRQSDLLEQRTNALLYSTLEALKSQRDLYIAMRDLFVRRDRLSVDNVDRLKKRVDSNSMKLEGIKAAQKDGWRDDADRIIGLIEKDQATIATLLNRRVFIRASMWHELRVVLHNKENALLSKLVQDLAHDEQTFASSVLANWVSLGNAVEEMPYE